MTTLKTVVAISLLTNVCMNGTKICTWLKDYKPLRIRFPAKGLAWSAVGNTRNPTDRGKLLAAVQHSAVDVWSFPTETFPDDCTTRISTLLFPHIFGNPSYVLVCLPCRRA